MYREEYQECNGMKPNYAALLALVLISVIFFAFFFFPAPPVGLTSSFSAPFNEVA